MQLKDYQQDVLFDLARYLELLTDLQSSAGAYGAFWTEKGVRVGGLDGMKPYRDALNGVPHVCAKVPTGGGKTFRPVR